MTLPPPTQEQGGETELESWYEKSGPHGFRRPQACCTNDWAKNLLVRRQQPGRQLLLSIADFHRAGLKQNHGHQDRINSTGSTKATACSRIQLLCD